MKKEEILLVLKEMVQENDNEYLPEDYKLNDLIKKIENDIRTETSYKGSAKSKIDAIKRICKVHEKRIPIILSGYNINSIGQYEFTDSYQAFNINAIDMPVKRVGEPTKEEKADGIETISGAYPNLQRLFYDFDDTKSIKLNVKNIMFNYKIRNKKQKESLYFSLKNKEGASCTINIEYLKNAIDILGADVKCCYSENTNVVLFENEKKEKGIILIIKNV